MVLWYSRNKITTVPGETTQGIFGKKSQCSFENYEIGAVRRSFIVYRPLKSLLKLAKVPDYILTHMLHVAVCTSMQVGKKVNHSWETKVLIKDSQRKVFPGHQEKEQCCKLGVIHV